MFNNISSKAIIHPSSIIEEGATVSPGCVIGPFCTVGSEVVLKGNTRLISHVVIDGQTTVDEGTVFYPYSSAGLIPQDLKYDGEVTKIQIGKNNRIREHSTIHLATSPLSGGTGVTKIGDNCLLMVNTHVAHDVVIGDNVVIANNVLLAGHVAIGDNAIIGGGTAVHQFCRIGEHTFIGGLSGVVADIVPYALFTGVREEGEINGINIVGLKRNGYTKEAIQDFKKFYDILFSKRFTQKENMVTVQEVFSNNRNVEKLLKFVFTKQSRSLCTNYKGALEPEKNRPIFYKLINKILSKYL